MPPQQIDFAIAAVLGLTLDERSRRFATNFGAICTTSSCCWCSITLNICRRARRQVSADLLANAPQVKVLVTSRVALGVPGEWFHPVDGLEVPARRRVKVEELATFDSVRLFQQCAQQASPGFDLSGEPIMSSVSAAWWMGCRWQLNWPRHGYGCCPARVSPRSLSKIWRRSPRHSPMRRCATTVCTSS